MADVVLCWCTDVLVVNDIEPLSGVIMQCNQTLSWSSSGRTINLGKGWGQSRWRFYIVCRRSHL